MNTSENVMVRYAHYFFFFVIGKHYFHVSKVHSRGTSELFLNRTDSVSCVFGILAIIYLNREAIIFQQKQVRVYVYNRLVVLVICLIHWLILR